jgi:hypothetical protein
MKLKVALTVTTLVLVLAVALLAAGNTMSSDNKEWDREIRQTVRQDRIEQCLQKHPPEYGETNLGYRGCMQRAFETTRP